MGRDLQILTNTRDHLVIVSPADTFNGFYIAMCLLVVLGLAYLSFRLWPVSRLLVGGIVLVVVLIGWAVAQDRATSYSMEMDRLQDRLTVKSYLGKDAENPLDTQTISLSGLQRADMESDRGSRRITISTQSGQQIHPLGDDFEHMDSQFLALGAIQGFLKQNPSAEPQP